MARNFNLPGGNLVVTDPDPLEAEIKRAQLAKLLQDPVSERAQLALQQTEARQRGQIAAGQHELGVGQLGLDTRKLAETLPIEKGKLTVEQQRAAGEEKYRTGTLAEETRFHTASNEAERARVKAGLVGDLMTHMLPQESVPGSGIAKGATLKAIAALGYGDISSSIEGAQKMDAMKRAMAFADQNKTVNEKQFGTLTAGLPPGTDPEFVNAAWNKYKTLHPETYGKDVSAAAEKALQPQEPTAQAPTSGGAYVAPGAGSASVGWAMGPDSPLASATPGLSALGPKNPQMGLVDPNTNEVLPVTGPGTIPTKAPPPVDQLVKTATAPQVAPVVAGAPPAAPAGPPQPVATTNALSFGGQPIPISLGISTGQSEQARELEAERKRQAMALQYGR